MTERAPKSRSRVFIILIVVVIVAAVAAFGAWSYLSGKESTDDAQVDGHINPVNAKIGGIVQAVNVKENQHVEAGQVLVQIDTRDYEIAVARAEADLADAEANFQ